jgi:hypothetical protein
MAITTLDGWIAASKQKCLWQKTATRTTIANAWFSMFELAGDPGAGTLAGSNTANGVVPTNATAGYPIINAFGGAATGYLGRVHCSNTIAGTRIQLFDKVFSAGAYAFNAATTLASQPSYSGRMPSGPDYNGTEIWIEAVTAFTGNLSVAVTYTNQSGTAARTTGTFATGTALTVGRMMQLPLQSGDSGIQKIESVTGTVATVGTFNVYVMRQLSNVYIGNAGESKTQNMLDTGLPVVFATSAFFPIIMTTSGVSSGTPTCDFDVING